MHNKFFIADTHFGHGNILTFKRNDGTPLREFASIEEHDETLIKNWNAVVRPVDTVYALGDIIIHRRNMPILGRLNGKKRLIRGNHDIFPTKEYMPYFYEILAYRVFNDTPKKFICSHIPIHPESLSRWSANVHGHLHSNQVNWEVESAGGSFTTTEKDPRYVCVSVEHTNYTPLHLDEVLERIA
jgi:calcineurin-like phosphoesterase family protein